MSKNLLLSMIGTCLLATAVQADAWNKKTELTVHENCHGSWRHFGAGQVRHEVA